jgi:hypothetical protein
MSDASMDVLGDVHLRFINAAERTTTRRASGCTQWNRLLVGRDQIESQHPQRLRHDRAVSDMVKRSLPAPEAVGSAPGPEFTKLPPGAEGSRALRSYRSHGRVGTMWRRLIYGGEHPPSTEAAERGHGRRPVAYSGVPSPGDWVVPAGLAVATGARRAAQPTCDAPLGPDLVSDPFPGPVRLRVDVVARRLERAGSERCQRGWRVDLGARA